MVGPEATEAGLINTVICCTWEIASKVVCQDLRLGRLREGPVNLVGTYNDAYLPAFFGNVKADKDVPALKVEEPMLGLHGKPPF
jgi:hypothetical protein